jgi:glutaredoxin 3
MPEVVIYTRPWCGYCTRAKMLLDGKGATYEEIDVRGDPDLWGEMVRRSGGRTTVPQIFIGEHHVGGCDDLFDLERIGQLEPLLRGES